jgi:6-phosphogluconate dehydrogenase
MELGIIGLGRISANMSERLVLGGHRVIGYDRSPEAIQRVVDHEAGGARRAETNLAATRQKEKE